VDLIAPWRVVILVEWTLCLGPCILLYLVLSCRHALASFLLCHDGPYCLCGCCSFSGLFLFYGYLCYFAGGSYLRGHLFVAPLLDQLGDTQLGCILLLLCYWSIPFCQIQGMPLGRPWVEHEEDGIINCDERKLGLVLHWVLACLDITLCISTLKFAKLRRLLYTVDERRDLLLIHIWILAYMST